MEVGVPSSQPAGTSTPPLPPNTSLVKQPTPTLGTDMQSFAMLIRAFRECKQILCMSSPSAAAWRAENAPHPKAATGHRQGLLKCISGRLGLGGGVLWWPSCASPPTPSLPPTSHTQRYSSDGGAFPYSPLHLTKIFNLQMKKLRGKKIARLVPPPSFLIGESTFCWPGWPMGRKEMGQGWPWFQGLLGCGNKEAKLGGGGGA